MSVLYPHPGTAISLLNASISLFLIILISALVLKYCRNKTKYAFTGWFWFLGTLVPVIGIIQVGAQSMADRYTYIPAIGIFVIFIWFSSELFQKINSKIAYTFIFLIVTILSISTWEQVQTWNNSKTLFQHATEVTKNNFVALSSLGLALAKENDLDQALTLCKKSVDINPLFPEGHSTLATVYMFKSMDSEAIAHFKEALRLKPVFAYASINLAQIFIKAGNLKEAEANLLQGEATAEDNSQLHNGIGIAWAAMGNIDRATIHFQRALLLGPDSADTLNNIGLINIIKKDYEEAKAPIEKALKISPLNSEILNNYGLILANENKIEEAIYFFSLALRRQPNYTKARVNLYNVLQKHCDRITLRASKP